MSNQLVKKNPAEGYQNVFPKTFIDAIKDKESGVSLQEILQGFNMYFLSYNGSKALTRCKIPTVLRKEGLWITYVLYDHTVVTEWYNSDQIDDNSWSMDSNWRVASNNLVGDVSVSADGYWVINGEKTEAKAQGEQGVTPLLRIGANNKLQVSYNAGKAWKDISDYIVPRFRWSQGTGTSAGNIQISMDLGKTWTNLSNEITNNLRISRYIGINESLPTSGIAEGTVYMKGPYYDEGDTSNANPIYRMWVYAWKSNTLAWQDNGEFTSISAGVVQETGDSETEVMSQKAVTEKLSELGQEVEYIGISQDLYNLSYTPNSCVNMSVGVGNVVSGVTPNNEGYNSIFIECEEGDKFIVTGFAGYLRLWGFLDENKTIISVAENVTTETEAIHIAPKGARYFASNSKDGKVFAEKHDSINIRINSTNDEVYKTQGDINSIEEVSAIKAESLSIVSIGGKYITNDGAIVDISSASITEPIKVNGGDYIEVVCSASNAFSVITQCDENGNNLIPLVIGSGDYQTTKKYNVKIDKDSYIIFTYRTDKGIDVKRKYSVISRELEQVKEEVKDVQLIKNIFDITPEHINIKPIDSKYITVDGGVADISFASITEPVKVSKGDYIEVVCSAVSTFSVITKCDENGNNRTPLVLGSGDYQSTKSYSLRVDFDGYVMFSYRTDKGIEALRYYSSNQFNIEDYEWCKYVFSKGICIGDSLTDGIVYDAPRTNEGGQQFRQYAYPAQLEKMTGWTLTNAGFGGISTSDWWKTKFADYDYREYEMAIIELGINGGLTDTLASDVEPYDNYKDYADTHTGNYCKIIEGMRASNPNIIIVLTIGNRMINSNAILATVVEKIALRYDLPIVDLRKTDEYDLNDNRYHGYNYLTDAGLNMLHFNFVGYLAKANLIYKQLVRIIYNRIKEVNDKVFS